MWFVLRRGYRPLYAWGSRGARVKIITESGVQRTMHASGTACLRQSPIWQLHQSSLAFVRARSDALVKVWGLCSSVSVQSDFAAPLVTYRLHPSQARHSFDGAREQHCSCLFARLTRFRMSG